MNETRAKEFREWMESTGTMKARPISDAISRCRRVEKGMQVDLDEEYRADRCARILRELEYSLEDVKERKKAPEGLNFVEGADLKNGLASLRAAIKKYIEFCDK